MPTLVLLAGPSGAGKDTLLAGAKAACAGDSGIVFPRRFVTRPADASEDHASLTEADFDAARREGGFAFWWDAHGNRYALPRSIDDDIRSGGTVLCNVSRGIVPNLRNRYARVLAVLITAPESALQARLSRRARESDGSLQERLARNELYGDFEPDHVIETTGPQEQALHALLAILRSR